MNPFPWYAQVDDDSLEQGDLFDVCPVFVPNVDALLGDLADFDMVQRDVIVMSQSCDLVQGREKVTEVLLCAVWYRSELPATEYVSTAKGLENARKGNVPGVHLLATCELPGLEREVRIVDFRRLYTLPMQFLRKRAGDEGPRLRLLPPYREHLSQAFARYFMRVGLPVDIAPFK
jgi:hypothetical protein